MHSSPVTFLIILLIFACNDAESSLEAARPDEADDDGDDDSTSGVTLLGLGKMGEAVAKCLSERVAVHAWNRGSEKRDKVRDICTVHETATAAIQASNVTMVLIDDWIGTVSLITDSVDKSIWKGKTLVLFSTYTPTSIQKLQREFFAGSTTVIVGGAIVGVPQTICSEKALILTSEPVPLLRSIGRNVAFSGDVGLAALANMSLILVITFGVAGHELALLVIKQYGADSQFLNNYTEVAAEVGPTYTAMLLPLVTQAIASEKYTNSYVPVGVFRRVLRMIAEFTDELGVKGNTYLTTYLDLLEKIPNEQFLPAAWITETVRESRPEL